MSLDHLFSPALVQKYLDSLQLQNTSPSTIKRKLSALSTFKKFLAKNNHLQSSPSPLPNPPQPPKQFSFPKFFNRYTLATLLIIIFLGLGYGLYTQTILRSKKNLAYSTASSPVRPGRILSFQGRLTDSSGNPVSSATPITFKFFNTGTGGTELYTSSTGNSQTVIPDSNGIFSVIIGKSHGDTIPTTVFSENAEVWLEITADSETMDPRQQIASVAYALNSDTLQGLPPSASGFKNTVLVIDGSGNLNLGETSPTIKSTSGTLGVEGQAILIKASDSSGGNISINPDANGIIKLLTEGTGSTAVGGFIEATNANLATGNLYSGQINNTNRGYNFLNFQNYNTGTTQLTTRFNVDAAGNVSIGGTLNIANSPVGTGTSMIYIDSSGNLIKGGLPAGTTYTASNGISLSGNDFQLGGSLSQLTKINLNNFNFGLYGSGNFGLGTTSPNAKLDVSDSTLSTIRLSNLNTGISGYEDYGRIEFYTNDASAYGHDVMARINAISESTTSNFGNLSFQTRQAGTGATGTPPIWQTPLYLRYNGYVGIGNTSPDSKLEVSDGNISVGISYGYIFNNRVDEGIYGNDNHSLSVMAPNNLLFHIDSNNNNTNAFFSVVNNNSAPGDNTNELFRIQENGYVGIGLTSPSYQLDLSGSFRVGGTFVSVGSTNLVTNLNANYLNGYAYNSLPYVNDASNTTLTRSGSGPYTLALNLGSTNTWTAPTTFSNNLSIGGTLTISNSPIGTGTSLLYIDSSGVVSKGALPTGTVYTASNGVTLVGNDFQLGGNLTTNTSIGTSSFNLSFLGLGNTQGLYLANSGYVGIGNTDPVGPLQIGVTGAGDTGPTFIVSSNGNVSIGGTGATDRKLYVYGTSYFTNSLITSGDGLFGGGDVYDSGGDLSISAEDNLYFKMDYNNDDSDLRSFVFTKNTTIGSTNISAGNELMRLTETGYLGIGTTSPQSTLHVDGTFSLTNTTVGTGTSILYIDSSGVVSKGALPAGTVYTASNGVTLVTNDFQLGGYLTQNTSIGTSSFNMVFTSLGGTQAFSVNSNGNVGIGATNVTNKLSISGNSASRIRAAISNANATSKSGALSLSSGGATGAWEIGGDYNLNGSDNFYIYGGGAGAPRLFINSSGQIGIGTTNQNYALTIGSTSAGAMNFNSALLTIGSNNDGYEFTLAGGIPDYTNMGGSIRIGGSARGDGDRNVIQFSQNGTERMRILDGGNVGIGATTPTAKLHVKSAGGANSGIKLEITDANSYGTIDFTTPAGLSGQFISTGVGFTNGIFTGDQVALANYLTNGSVSLVAGGSNGYLNFATGGYNSKSYERMRIDPLGNVGIGLTTLTYKFSVGGTGTLVQFGTGTAGSNILSGTYATFGEIRGGGLLLGDNLKPSTINSGTMVVVNGSTTLGARGIFMKDEVGIAFHTLDGGVTAGNGFTSERMRIDENGNVGIGTTDPQYQLDITGSLRVGGTFISVGSTNLVTNLNTDLLDGYHYNNLPYMGLVSFYNGIAGVGSTYGLGGSLSIGTSIDQNNYNFSFLGSGNFGIGITNPLFRLSTSGTQSNYTFNRNLTVATIIGTTTITSVGTTFSDDDVGRIVYLADGTTRNIINVGTNTSLASVSGSNFGAGDTNTVSLYHPYFHIDDNGRIGINTVNVANPSTQLQINGDLSADRLTDSTLYDKLYLDLGNALEYSPSMSLFKQGSITFNAYINSGATLPQNIDNAYASRIFGATNGLAFAVGDNATADSYINWQNSLFIKGSNGYVGVGNTDPQYQLDITGSLRVGGTFISVGSTNLVTNLNADLLDGYHYNNLPYESILTFNNGLTRTTNTVGLGGTLSALTKIDLNGNNFGFFGSGNFGVGTSSPKTPLQITGVVGTYVSSPFLGSTTGASFLMTNSDYNYGLLGGVTGSTGNAWLQVQRVDGTAAAYDLALQPSGGNVGIGITDPLYKLHVYGSVAGGVDSIIENISNSSSAYSILRIKNDTANQFVAFLNSSARSTDGGVNNATIRNDAGPLRLQSNGGNGIFIGIGGSVGIGTSNPGGLFQVGTADAGGTGPVFTVKNTGFVGIGTTSPGRSLDIYQPNAAIGIRDRNTGKKYVFTNLAVGDSSLGLYDETANSWRWFVKANGNVGVGATDPATKLEIRSTNQGAPANSGTSQPYATTRIRAGDEALDIGVYGTGMVWMQVSNATTLATKYPLVINPNGGNVGIGTSNPGGLFQVGTAGAGGTGPVFTVKNTGYVGIGTTNPTGIFSVQEYLRVGDISMSQIQPSGDKRFDFGATSLSGYYPGIALNNSNVASSATRIMAGTALSLWKNMGTGSSWGHITSAPYGAAGTTIPTWNYSMNFDGSGNVAIGSTNLSIGSTTAHFVVNDNNSSTPRFAVAPSGNNLYMFGAWQTSMSDRNMKKNIVDQSTMLSKIMQLRPVTYNWKNNGYFDDDLHYGVIAQEIAEVFPSMVYTDQDGHLNLRKDEMAFILLKGFQEQQALIDSLGNKLNNTIISENGQIQVDQNISQDILASLGYSDTKNEIENATYSITDNLGKPITSAFSAATATIAQIKAGLVNTTNLIAKNIVSETNKSKSISTAVISPLSDLTDTIVVDGNLNVAGTLTAQVASISTLYADNIISAQGSFQDIMANKIQALRAEIKNQVVGTTLMTESSNWTFDVGTSQLAINGSMSLSDNLVIGSQLIVNGQAQLGSAFVTGTFTAGEIAIKDNLIETTASALYLQPSAVGSIHLLGDTMVIADSGDVTINGDLNLNGTLTAQTASVSGSLFANMIAADQATITNLSTTKLNVATESATIIAESGFGELATSSAQVQSNATAGTVNLPVGKTEIVITNSKLTPNSIVYLTPVGSTNNQVIYLKQKTETTFTIGLDQPLSNPIDINWWLIN